MPNTAPLGILGGTFDPIHYRHLRLAEELADALKLAEVRLIPGGTPPHRAAPATAATHRLAMAALAIVGNARFAVDAREVRRSGPGYTYDTLAELRAEEGAQRPLVLLLGADAFLELATWHRWHSRSIVARWTTRLRQTLAANARSSVTTMLPISSVAWSPVFTPLMRFERTRSMTTFSIAVPACFSPR